MFLYMSMFYMSTKLFQQILTFYMINVKMTKFGIKIGLCAMHVFVFFCIGHKEYPFFIKHSVTTKNMEIMCIFFPNFFDILKFIFQIKGAYAQETKSAFPAIAAL
jgi:hypothetical protein